MRGRLYLSAGKVKGCTRPGGGGGGGAPPPPTHPPTHTHTHSAGGVSDIAHDLVIQIVLAKTRV